MKTAATVTAFAAAYLLALYGDTGSALFCAGAGAGLILGRSL